MNINSEKVLVTGASGYIALHCITELIKNGYKVKGSIRDLSKKNKIKNFLKLNSDDDKFELCELNLLKDKGWIKAASDCDYLLHIASPCVIKEPKNEFDIINPAVQGTLRALDAAKKTNIKKVVLTSSLGSITYGHQKSICKPTDWTDITEDIGSYIRSKTIAEKTAWDYLNSFSSHPFKFTSINPGLVFGPPIANKTKSTSVNLINKMIEGEFPALPNIFFSIVDVRDVAKLHVKSLNNNNSDNKRIIASASESIHFLEISKILRNLGYKKSPLNSVPNKLLNLLGIFNEDMRISYNMVKRGYFSVDNSETKSIFDWDPIPLQKTLEDMCNSLKK